MSLLEEEHKEKEKHHYEYWHGKNMPKECLEEMLCGWMAMAMLARANPIQYAKDCIEESSINIFSKRYLLNKIQVKGNFTKKKNISYNLGRYIWN